MLRHDFDNPWGIKTPKGKLRKMSALLDSAVFPGSQGGPLEHVIAAKAVAFKEALSSDFITYQKQVVSNARALAQGLVDLGYKIISGGTDNHSLLIDLRSKNITGKEAEKALEKAEITVNKNMVPFDDKSPFVTSGIRIGTSAITTRGVNTDLIPEIVTLIDAALMNREDETKLKEIKTSVNQLMSKYPIFNW